MARKTEAENHGVPLLVDASRDLPAKPGNFADSWYVICNFRAGGREIGFEWHQMVLARPAGELVAAEFLLMDATRGIWLPHAVEEPAKGEIGAAADRCRVTSSFGTLEGDSTSLTLRLETADGAVDVVMRPRAQTLYNGTIGLLPILGNTYQYSWPNMDVSGTIRLKDEVFEISGTTAWFDRQWSFRSTAEGAQTAVGGTISSLAWLWLGMTLDPEAKSAISLWDITNPDGKRYAFATIIDEHGVQANHAADVTYEHIWESASTGNNYPRALKISIPTANLDLSLETLLDQAEFVRDRGEDNATGSQAPCAVRGHYGAHGINRVVIVEMIGDVCGEAAAR